MKEILNNIGAIMTLLFGIWAFILPVQFSKIISLTPYKKTGITEIRATYGGLIMGLGGYALWSQTDTAFQFLAVGWFSIAMARIIGARIDDSYSTMTMLFILIELGTGLMLFI